MTPDARYVVFESGDPNLDPQASGSPFFQNVYLRDRVGGTTKLIDRSTTGGAPNGDSQTTSGITPDGHYLVYASKASNLVAGDTNGVSDVFVYNTQSGTTTRASVSSSGVQGNGNSSTPSISADGRYVVFQSDANNLVPNDTNGLTDVFVHDMQTGATTRVSVASDGTQGNGGGIGSASGLNPQAISADGRYVVFSSGSSNLVPRDTNSGQDAFLHDMQTGTTQLVDLTPDGRQPTTSIGGVVISADGTHVAFGARNMLPGNNNNTDVYVRDLATGALQEASVSSSGQEAVTGQLGSISSDGRYVIFMASAAQLGISPPTASGFDVFLRDTLDGTTERVSVSSTGDVSNGSSFSYGQTVSDDGRYVLFASQGSNLVPSDSNTNQDIFLRDRGVQAPADTTPPTTIDDAPAGWSALPVVVHLTATDDVSGVASTLYSVDGGPLQSGTVITIPAPVDHSNDGVHTISYYSVDSAGNIETPHLTAVKIDTSSPTITAISSPAANASGWNNGNVTVTFTCSDSLSGIANCPLPVTLGPGAGQTATGTAVDNAGNSASASLTGINVDEAAPTIVGSPTTQPNANGWYAGDVTVHWTCADDLSGISGICPADDVITGEGDNLTSNEGVADIAGNVATASSPPVRVDRTPPVTTASAPSGWSNTGVTVTLSAIDNLSGVAVTYYQLDGGVTQSGTSVTINDEGIHTLTFWSTDLAGNVEAARTMQVKIDKTAPTITHTLDPLPDGAGWNDSPVKVTFVCSDSLSGIAACTPALIISSQGKSQPVTGTANDNAGNSATDTAYVSVDTTPPSITATPDRAANANDWYDAPVTVSFSCSDALSGIAACPASVVLGEGASQSASGTATDAAGNTMTATLSGINIDTTPPLITYAGNAGSYTVDQSVSISCSATDALSGVSTSTCADITGPAWTFGLGLITPPAASATDRAGNTSTITTSFTVTVDSTSLCALIHQFMAGDVDGADGLCAKAEAISSAPNPKAKNGLLGAFDNQVAAKTGNPLTASEAALLKRLAAGL